VLQFESRSPDANITTGGDALWWSAVTITTVGYGDYFPVTTLGRFAGLLVMLAGVHHQRHREHPRQPAGLPAPAKAEETAGARPRRVRSEDGLGRASLSRLIRNRADRAELALNPRDGETVAAHLHVGPPTLEEAAAGLTRAVLTAAQTSQHRASTPPVPRSGGRQRWPTGVDAPSSADAQLINGATASRDVGAATEGQSDTSMRGWCRASARWSEPEPLRQ
jgi:hypothetical protein